MRGSDWIQVGHGLLGQEAKEKVTVVRLLLASLRYSISSEAQNNSSMRNAWSWLDWHPFLGKKNLKGACVRSIFENSGVN